ncbi:MAG: right-handed parallel beta-helix repeat-containing protein [Prevotellaceae bacterium]|jgi:hypothetical protein|nr:right-handed parallel beta-helix repeat-containing protein [Prevotellaceae bacterium]
MHFKNHTIIALLFGVMTAGCSKNSAPNEPDMRLYDPDGAVLYNYPEEADPSDAYAVAINEMPYFVFPVPQTIQRPPPGFLNPFTPHIVNFDIAGKVMVEITPKKTINAVKIRPESAGISCTLKGNTLKLFLEKPQFLSVEINNDIENPLLLFANEPETEIPDKDDPNVIFFEAGKIHERSVGALSNQTVYLAPGAIVYGAIKVGDRSNVRIMGRGILSGAKFPTEGTRPVEFEHVTNGTIEGITIVDCKGWSMPLVACNNITVSGIKIVSNTGMEDGIDIVGSKNVTVDRCFIRTKDDCIALKAGITYYDWRDSRFAVENILVKNCVIWNGKHGNGIEIGYELDADTVRNVIFENIDLIHTENPGLMDDEGSITIHNSGRAVIHDILYKNIRIEDPQRILFHFAVLESVYSPASTMYGKIMDVRLEDITVTSSRGTLRSKIMGYSSTQNVQGIAFKNLTFNGDKVTTGDQINLSTNAYVANITFE